ncbi:MAG: response regulator transcription factor [Oscillospiraceae bacterium]|nr:response regulator transcription factor [Oscillospiraceae bacterium]MBQ4165286.1 response regulator transcription factor [Oscillospiraceae bacterium]
MKRILVCEDEEAIRDFVVINLGRAGYDVVDVASGEEAVNVYLQQEGNFDVALLDIMMPGMDGFSLCKWIREQSSEIGIIMLSAKSQEMDKVNCLMIGADDYVTKPFSPSELVARVDAIYRRVNVNRIRQEEPQTIRTGPFLLDCQSRTVCKNGELIELTQVEYQIMEYLLKNLNTALDRRTILRHVWGEAYYGDDKVVDVNIRRLRMKIEDDPSSPYYIQTIWGFGYKWNI